MAVQGSALDQCGQSLVEVHDLVAQPSPGLVDGKEVVGGRQVGDLLVEILDQGLLLEGQVDLGVLAVAVAEVGHDHPHRGEQQKGDSCEG